MRQIFCALPLLEN